MLRPVLVGVAEDDARRHRPERDEVIGVVSDVPGHTVVSLTVSGLIHFPAAFFYGSDQVKVLD